VIVLPIYFFWQGPIKLGHRDGEWEPFDLVSRDECAESHSYFVLRRKKPERYWWGWYATETSPLETLYSRSPIMSVQIQNPSLQIQRSYTPLNLSSEEIHLVIKRYADGDLSRFLFNLTPGRATVWVKQGRQEWDFRDGEWDHVVFVCGGTGITPAFQLALSALQRQKLKAGEDPNAKRTRFTILASAQDAKSILLRQELGTVNHVHGDGLLRVRYFIDRMPKGVKLPEDIQQGPVTEKAIRQALALDRGEKKGWFGFGGEDKETALGGKTMVLVCGTDGFTRYVAGEHGGVAGKQGVKGGLLKNINGIEVFKMLESPNAVQPKKVTDSNLPVGNVA
jgi:ferredoxin-NADP reductase